MKIFISGHIQDKTIVQNYYQKLEGLGHEVTHDWTRGENIKVKIENQEELGKRASKDINGVINCDAYALITTKESGGRGMYVELGAALAQKETTGKPEIYIVGKLTNISVFYMHPKVKYCKDFDEFIGIVSAK